MAKKAKLDLRTEAFPFQGKIKLNEAGFGFVNFNSISIYVSPKLLKDKGFNDLDLVSGMFVSSFDKKKEQEGFKATEIKKIETNN
ncbi:MAG: hypothetical protein MJ211_05360 [Bacteroidales bacterium]|nr:hypothetical protein [Bacteroidales bacterium]